MITTIRSKTTNRRYEVQSSKILIYTVSYGAVKLVECGGTTGHTLEEGIIEADKRCNELEIAVLSKQGVAKILEEELEEERE